ncbi:alpha/beta fold hydrolase [Streptomyces sp. NPDC051561]|uniref:alpha/beta fold hydrolase n=1 Tax=Streptomyces sp. NPDC051561 TaxID=3365658 RepID=UPI0037B41EEB
MHGQLPPLGRMYEVGERRLMLHRSGDGGPAVVLVPGAGLVGLDFLNIQAGVAGFTTSVLYDRAGTGWSERVELPRRPGEVAEELRALLYAAGVPGPYVLVGHSLGASYARRFAQLFPGEVAGLVLLDPGHEDMLDHVPEELAPLAEQMKPGPERLPDLTEEQVRVARGQWARLYAWWPEEVREPLIEQNLTSWRTAIEESRNFETEVHEELRRGGALPDVPVSVISASGSNPYWARFMSEEQQGAVREGIRRLHAGMVAPGGEHREIADASHQYAHIEHPEAVLAVIRELHAKA